MELRKQNFGVPTLECQGEGHMNDNAKRESSVNAAESKTLSRRGNSMRENRETPAIPTAGGGMGRSEKATSHTADMHVAGESDGLIVPTKRTNKAGLPTAAESTEGRGPTKGNVLAVGHAPDTAPGPCVDRLEGVRPVSSERWTVSPKVRAV
jgi:hypothetical protein